MKRTRIKWKLLAKDTRKARADLDMGVREFAKAAGLSPSTISRIENAKRCDAETFVHVAQFLGYGIFAYVEQRGET